MGAATLLLTLTGGVALGDAGERAPGDEHAAAQTTVASAARLALPQPADSPGRERRRPALESSFAGHLKPQLLTASYPERSVLRTVFSEQSLDLNLDLRLDFDLRRGRWDVDSDLQLLALQGDTIEATRGTPGIGFAAAGRFPEDNTRLFDLTAVHTDNGRFAGLSRFDRLSLGYSGRKMVLRFGRQAISWGNGFIYAPMDIFNPFDPTAVDKEYKAGDDMLYGQYLSSRGDDLQGVMVVRRDPLTGEVQSDHSSLALKYHGLVGVGEYDVLVARHYGEDLLGLGGNRSIGGAVWRGDLTLTKTTGAAAISEVAAAKKSEIVISAVTSLSTSWILGGKNWSGAAEAFYSGFGHRRGQYSTEALAANPALLERLQRGELYTLGRLYLAFSTTVEMTPLFLLTPNLFVNAEDHSSLLQVVGQWDLVQDLVLQIAVGLPLGPEGTEFGGIATSEGSPGSPPQRPSFFSSDANLFAQLAWYF